MEEHQHPFATSPTTPRFPPPYSHGHRRNISRSPTRNRVSVTDDIFTDFSPTRILEAFINPTGRLKASIDAASQTDRTFGIRAAHASKNIQEWVRELEEWEWPTEGASVGFEVPPGKRRKLSLGEQNTQNGSREPFDEPEYIGSLLAPKVLEYEARIEHMNTELEDLHVEEIKRYVLETHFTPSRPSSSSSNASSTYLSSYTKMEDFTAIVTATVLKALPNLSKLMHLMDVWSVRLSVLHKVPRLLQQLEEGEMALRSGWTAIRIPVDMDEQKSDEEILTREAFEIIRQILQDKVSTSGRDLDFMLDILEGREDTLPESWLDRMETIERDYGEWAVAGDRKVREGEWAKMAKIRKQREEEAARIRAQLDAQAAEAELHRLLAEKKAKDAETARLKAEEDAQKALAEIERLRLEKEIQEEAARLKNEEDAAVLGRRKEEEAESARLEVEEAQRLEKQAMRLAKEKENAARVQAENTLVDAKLAKLKADEAETLRLHEKLIWESTRQEELNNAAEAELTRRAFEQGEINRLQVEKETHEATVEATRIQKEREIKEAQALRAMEKSEARKLAFETSRLAEECRTQDVEANRVREELELTTAAKLEEDRESKIAEATQIQSQHEAELAAAAKLAEEHRIQEAEANRLREEYESQEAAKNAQLANEPRIQQAEARRINEEQELVQLALAAKLEDERIQESEATRLREEQAHQTAMETKHIEDDQKERDEVDQLRKEAESAALTEVEARKSKAAEISRLDAEKISRDLATAKFKAEHDEAQAELSRQQARKSQEDEDALARQIAKQEATDIKTVGCEAKIQAQEVVSLRLDKEKGTAEKLADEVTELELSNINRHQDQDEKDAVISRMKAHDEAETARLKSETDTIEAAQLYDLQQKIARDADLAIRKDKEDAARLERETNALEPARLQAEDEAIDFAQSKARQDARKIELQEFERLQALKISEVEANRLKAFQTAERERAEIARVRALLSTNAKIQHPQQAAQDINEFSRSSYKRKSPIVPVVSLDGVAAHVAARSFGPIDSECDVCVKKPTPPNKYATFDGTNDLESALFVHHECDDFAFDEEMSLELNAAEEWASTETGVNPAQDLHSSAGFTEIEYTPSDDAFDGFAFQPEPHKIIPSIQYATTSDPLPTSHQNSPPHAGHFVSIPTPEILDAEPASYFRPSISSVKSTPPPLTYSGPNISASSLGFSDLMSTSISPNFDKPVLPQRSSRRHPVVQNQHIVRTDYSRFQPSEISSFDGSSGSVPARSTEMELHDFKPHSLARKTSITRINSPSQISITRRDSASSNSSTIMNSPMGDVPASPRRIPSPIRPSTPTSPQTSGSFQEDDLSPSIRRHRNGKSHDYTSPDSPPPIPNLSKRGSISHSRNDSFSSLSRSSDSPTTPTFTVDPSPALTTSPKKASSDDHMQQQISNLLESIPARIRLTTESDVSTPDISLNVTKTRRPMASSLRSSSSMSNHSRAPTPSFTLAPARGAPRQRAQNGNPEIKVYHLSRSTGEAPIKLFVRLVGENGERVMVRVGGGWADLGEYLKEYASHHGRRAAVGDNDKVEIQDLPPRIVSIGSASSTPTIRSSSMTYTPRSSTMTPMLRSSSSIANIRSNGRASPAPPSRSGSVMGFNRPPTALGKPTSSLAVRKTRQSTGSNLDLPSPSNTFRIPSTPMPSTLSRSTVSYDTTPSPERGERERSSSRLSWTEEESSLGLAGPKAKKVVISERDQEWVESMKEKVRLASAEKDKEKGRRESGGRKSFGEMDRVGGVKRLWKTGGL